MSEKIFGKMNELEAINSIAEDIHVMKTIASLLFCISVIAILALLLGFTGFKIY